MTDDAITATAPATAPAAAPDYPAAHSMDTAWFAIDLDGNVAVFDTGESGCVPEDAYTEDAYELQEQIRALPASGYKLDPDGFRETQWSNHVDTEELDPETRLHMFLSDLVPVQDLLDRLGAQPVDTLRTKCVLVTGTDPAAFAELHARSACLGCYRNWSDEEDLASHGVYRYEHTCENWIAGPYARATVPAKPLTIEDQTIPQAIRDQAVAYNGRFADTPKLQPAEHWPCTSWESGWLSSDGKTARPFEDRADDWQSYAGDRADINADAATADEGTDAGAAGGPIEFLDEPLDPPPAKRRWWK